MLIRFVCLLASIAIVGCSTPPQAPVISSNPTIELTPSAGGWTANPVKDELDIVSHGDGGYTGEIDRFEITTPAAGRLQVSLHWEHSADFDLILSSDPQGKFRLVEGIVPGQDAEYVRLDVAGNQTIYVIVAGWDGDPGEYTLETILLPPGAPVFTLDSAPDPELEHARNLPLVFRFNVRLDPNQDLDARIFFVGPGLFAEGEWCIDGRYLTFYPRLPIAPGWGDGLEADVSYIVQFPRGARGPRAVTGEYLTELEGITLAISANGNHDPKNPPRVIDVNWPAGQPWDGTPVTLTISGAIDPETIAARLLLVGPGGFESPLPAIVQFQQGYSCLTGALRAKLTVDPTVPLPPAATVRIRIPGTVLELGSDEGLTGPVPAPAGEGYSVDFTTP